MNTDQTSEIDGTVIEALRPQSRRYDVAIEDGLVLSVLPNGVKTWTWVYDDPADPQRKTLGIYPAMSLEEARQSLAAEISSQKHADNQEPEFVIRDGRIEAATPSSSQLPIIAGAIVALFAIGVIIYLVMDGSEDSTVDDSSPFVENSTGKTIQLPTINPALPVETSNDTRGVAIADTQVQPGQLAAEAQPPEQTIDEPDVTSMTAAEMQAPAVASRSVEPVNEPQTNSVPDRPTSTSLPVAVPPTTPDRPAANTTVTANDTTATDTTVTTDETAATNTTVTANDTSATNTTMTANNTAAANTATNPAIVADTTATATTDIVSNSNNVAITDSRVARGVLTTAVVEREPIDDLGASIVGNGTDLQTYYFFTELRQLAGQQVRHRWVHRDGVVAEVPFNVGEAWRWRVYSSKTFIPSMSGDWQVQVVLEDDTVIHTIPFTFIP